MSPQIQDLWNSGQIEMPYLTLTKSATAPNSAEQWCTINNILLVNFTDPYPNPADIANFMTVLGLTTYSSPDPSLPTLSQGPSYTYAFTVNAVADPVGSMYSADYYAEIARQAFTNFNGLVANAEPNIVNHRVAYKSGNQANVGSITNTTTSTCPTNDPEFGVLNHIENTGTASNIPYNPAPPYALPNGTLGADAHICGCWSQGLSGAGVTVGVIGFSHLYFSTNPDMDNRYDPTKLWDCSSGICNPMYSIWSTYNNASIADGIAHAIAQGIAANANDNFGTVGVSPSVNLRMYDLGTPYTFSTIAAVKTLQQALVDNDDIVVMDWFMPAPQPSSISVEISKLYNLGRTSKGSILIAPAGHLTGFVNVGLNTPMYPAAVNGSAQSANVIGVIASNRFDQRCDYEYLPSMGVPYTYPTNYGNMYEIAAPGPALPNAISYPSSPGYAYLNYDWFPEIGALATVAGVVAMLLEQDPNLSEIALKNLLVAGADQVGGYVYNGGYSEELGRGRINCENSLNLLLSTSIQNQEVLGLNVSYSQTGWTIKQKMGFKQSDTISLWDILGNIVGTYPLIGGVVEIPSTHLSKGVYFLRLDSNTTSTMKLLNY